MTSDVHFEIVTRGGHPEFLELPWGEPLESWDHPRMVKMAHGISRHIVRFVRFDDRVYALKETEARIAAREYRILTDLRSDELPVVEPVGVVTGSPTPDAAVLITRYLDYSLPYWYVIGRRDVFSPDKLMDAGVVLLVRLHLEGVFWGDCSLSNILWRRDAGALMAYMVDAETTERHDDINDRMRDYDLQIAEENIIGGLMDLMAAGRVDDDVDPFATTAALRQRYEDLWNELTRVDEFGLEERWRIDQRVRRINELGFDVEELAMSRDGQKLSMKPVLIDEGHHSRELRRRTGLDVQENQARRLLADIASYKAWLERTEEKEIPAAVAAARWLANVYEPVVTSIPDHLRDQLEPAETFHQMLEHRYLMSERLGRGVTSAEAMDDFIEQELRHQPAERQLDVAALDPAVRPTP